MNEKFTPGPIQKEFNNDARWLLTDEDGYPIADVYGGDMITDEANANLFAAAPELYEVLEKLRGFISSLPEDSLGSGTVHVGRDSYKYPIRDEVIDNINKVIKKARGE